MSMDDKRERYLELAHAMQSGIALMMSLHEAGQAEDIGTTPKHLRVGIDTTKVEHGALVSLLVKKGVFTDIEYADEVIKYYEKEVANIREELSKALGGPVDLA